MGLFQIKIVNSNQCSLLPDDEELVDDKRNSPSAINDDDNDSVSTRISRMCQTLKDKFLGSPSPRTTDDQPEAMETDNA